jgi:hypothetical protein
MPLKGDVKTICTAVAADAARAAVDLLAETWRSRYGSQPSDCLMHLSPGWTRAALRGFRSRHHPVRFCRWPAAATLVTERSCAEVVQQRRGYLAVM